MIKMLTRVLLMGLLLAAIAVSSLGQPIDPLEAVCTTSQSLTAYSAMIRMTQYGARDDSVIEFSFDFVPPDRMRIVYTAPAAVVDQTMILNGDRLYTYIPSLQRRLWKDAEGDGGNQGEEMGFLYDFVTQSASEALGQSSVVVAGEREEFVLETTGETLEVDVMTMSEAEERQVVLLNAGDAVPVSVLIYHGDDLTMEVCVLSYEIDGEFEDAWFSIPEK